MQYKIKPLYQGSTPYNFDNLYKKQQEELQSTHNFKFGMKDIVDFIFQQSKRFTVMSPELLDLDNYIYQLYEKQEMPEVEEVVEETPTPTPEQTPTPEEKVVALEKKIKGFVTAAKYAKDDAKKTLENKIKGFNITLKLLKAKLKN